MAQVLVADEQPIIRQALRELVVAEGHRVAGECSDGAQALQLTGRLRPDVIVLDLSLQRLGGLEVIQRLRQVGNLLPVLVYTSQDSPHHAALSLQAGATGFVSKLDDLQVLRDALSTLLQGRSHFPALALGTVASQTLMHDEKSQLRSLSPRELTVLRYLANGSSNRQIAEALALSDRTVSTYKVRLLQKLNVASLAELLELAWRNGMLGHMPQSASEKVSSDHFYKLFDSLPIAACLRDLAGRLLACNQQFLSFYGVEREAVLGRHVADLVELNDEDVGRYREIYQRAVELGEPYSCDALLEHGGRKLSLRHSGIPWRDESGVLTGMLCSFVDLTEHQREIAELAQAQARGEMRRRVRAQFLQTAGQDLLAQIRQLRDLLPTNIKPALQLVAVIDERLEVLLDLVRLERGDLILEPQRADLRRLTEEVVEARRVDWHCELPNAAPAWVDVRRYRQLLSALLEECSGERPALEGHMTLLNRGESDWCLRVHPCTEPVYHSATLLLAERLAELMGGELRWNGDEMRLRLRFLQVL